MNRAPYLYTRESGNRYSFISEGKRSIIKVVDFTSMGIAGFYNLGFGDLLNEGLIDYKSISNNGDIIRVVVTLIHIIHAFFEEFPTAEIYFAGSTQERNLLYNRVIKTYFAMFSSKYVITAFREAVDGLIEVNFDDKQVSAFVAFSIKRII